MAVIIINQFTHFFYFLISYITALKKMSFCIIFFNFDMEGLRLKNLKNLSFSLFLSLFSHFRPEDDKQINKFFNCGTILENKKQKVLQ